MPCLNWIKGMIKIIKKFNISFFFFKLIQSNLSKTDTFGTGTKSPS